MDSEKNDNLEKQYVEGSDLLLDIYNTARQPLSPDEEESTYPILNSLTEGASRYREMHFIAEGGEKKITCVYDRMLNRNVAMARPAKANTRKEQEQFLREAHLGSNLAHPNIIPIHNIGIDENGTPFFTMEMLPGDNLNVIFTKLKEGDTTYISQYPQDRLFNIFLKICDAIAYAHSRGVLHLDIKPDNIQVGQFGETYVCDWGLARVVSDENAPEPDTPGELDADMLNQMTSTGFIKGSPGFMAPEQTSPEGIKTRQTDIYALGAILYQILTKHPPIEGRSNQEIIQNTQNGKITHPKQLVQNLSLPTGPVASAMKALSLKPEERYASVIELQQDISLYLSGFPTKAEKATLATSFAFLVQRHSRLTSSILVFLLILAVVIGVNLNIINHKRIAAEEATKTAENNFRLFKSQREKSDQLADLLADSTSAITLSRNYPAPRRTIRALNEIATQNLSPKELKLLLEQKGTLLFLIQNFNEAAACFQQIENTETLARLCSKYGKIKPQDSDDLSDRQFIDLLFEVRDIKLQLSFYNHNANRFSSNAYPPDLPLVQAMLDIMNSLPRGTTRITAQKTAQGNHLDLSNTKLATFTLLKIGGSGNVLQTLNPCSIDLSNTAFQDPDQLTFLRNVTELNLAGSQVNHSGNLTYRLKRMGVKTLTVGKNQFPRHYVKALREHMTVLEK